MSPVASCGSCWWTRAPGHGLNYQLVATCLDFARRAGYARMQLWTNDVLAAARRVYLRHGFTLTASQPHRSFGADLVGQTYETELTRDRARMPG